eukprot:6454734-Amphidinium_carterae.2
MQREPPTKPPPGFPKGTSIPMEFVMPSAGTIAFQPAFLAEQAMQMGQMARTDSSLHDKWLDINNECNDRQHSLSTRFLRISSIKLQSTKWSHGPDGKKCGKNFCYNNRRKCGSKVAYNIKPPHASGVKDFSDCLRCDLHEETIGIRLSTIGDGGSESYPEVTTIKDGENRGLLSDLRCIRRASST